MNFFHFIYWLFSHLMAFITGFFGFCLTQHLLQRRNALPPAHLSGREWIWIQAVSLGELLLVPELVGRMLEKKVHIHITTSTKAGRDLLNTLLQTRLKHGHITGGFFPIDLKSSLNPWIDAKPKCVILMETELWPNLIHLCSKNHIPIGIVNGRLTVKSTKWIKSLTMHSLSQIDFVIARDHDSEDLFRKLGASRVHYGGNLKAANVRPEPMQTPLLDLKILWESHPVWIMGNTLDGEEVELLNLWKKQKETRPNLKCILAPRQPKRFGDVEALIKSLNLTYTRASIWKKNTQLIPQDILLLDTVGDLATIYQLGEFAFVGGGWSGNGGHNPLEPLRYGVRTFMGPRYDNFEDIVRPLLTTNSLWALPVDRLPSQIKALMNHDLRAPDPALGSVLREFGKALDRTWKILEPRI